MPVKGFFNIKNREENSMEGFEVIDTQEKLERILEQERDTVKKQYEGYLSPEAAAKKYEGYLSPEDEKKKYEKYLSPEAAAEKEKKIKGYETESLKVRAALAAGIPYELASKLSGEDEESIKKDAEIMAGYLKSGRGTAPLADPEPPAEDAKKTAMKKMLAGLKGE